MGSVLFIHHVSRTTSLETQAPLAAEEDVPDGDSREPVDETSQRDSTMEASAKFVGPKPAPKAELAQHMAGLSPKQKTLLG